MGFTLPCSWSIRACILSWFFLSSSPAKISSLIDLSDFLRFLETSANFLPSASSSDSSSAFSQAQTPQPISLPDSPCFSFGRATQTPINSHGCHQEEDADAQARQGECLGQS